MMSRQAQAICSLEDSNVVKAIIMIQGTSVRPCHRIILKQTISVEQSAAAGNVALADHLEKLFKKMTLEMQKWFRSDVISEAIIQVNQRAREPAIPEEEAVMRRSYQFGSVGSCILCTLATGCWQNASVQNPAPPTESAVPVVVKPPPKPSGTVDERLVKAEKMLTDGQSEEAIVVLDEAVLIDSTNRKLLGMLVRAYAAAGQAAKTKDPAKYYRYSVTCGGYMRELRDKFKDLTSDEKALVLNTLRNEAAAHAKSKRVEETVGSLRELAGAGFKEFGTLKNDPDFAEIFQVESFQKQFDEITREK